MEEYRFRSGCPLPLVTVVFAVSPAGGRGCVPGYCHCRPDQLPRVYHQGHEQECCRHHRAGQEERQVVLVLLTGDRGLSRLLCGRGLPGAGSLWPLAYRRGDVELVLDSIASVPLVRGLCKSQQALSLSFFIVMAPASIG